MSTVRSLAALTACAGVMLVRAVGAAPPPADLPLTVNVTTSGTAGVFGVGGPYVSGQQSVSAVLLGNTNGNFVFDLNTKTGRPAERVLMVIFPDAARDALAATRYSVSTPYYVDAYLGTLTLSNTTQSLRTMKIGDVQYRRGPISWVDGANQYALRWSGSAGIGALQFTCDAVDPGTSTSCSAWTVTPTPSASDPTHISLAQFDSTPTKGGNQTIYGAFEMPLKMTLTK